ncbi:MAG: ribosome maturation factor [Balneolaceae bacterium]|nr:MAG: ribosome maturation factor [Balneolaceae bacterium]
MQKDITEVVKELSEPIVNQQKMFLVDVELKHKKVPEVWILVDTEEGGVNVDKCSAVSREVANLLEEQNVFGDAYRLNVSSPGLSRPLSDRRQYSKNIGRTAKVKYKVENNYYTVEGVIEAVNNELITILDEKDEKVDVPFSQIVETKIIPKI